MNVEYDAERRTYRTYYETRRDSPSLAIVEAIATIEDIASTELEPLVDTVEVDAIDAALRSSSDDRESRITLSYEGYDVVIQSSGVMELQPADSDTAE